MQQKKINNNNNTNKIKLRIILPGGGAKGIFQLGFLSELFASNLYEVDQVYGTSIGAILAPFVAVQKLSPLLDFFLNQVKSIDDVVNKRKFLGCIPITNYYLRQYYMFFHLGEYQSIKFIPQIYDYLTPEELAIAKKKCHVVSYEILHNQETWFTGEELLKGIECSSALWLAIPPISYKEGLYTDGGTSQVFPIDYVLQRKNDDGYKGIYLFVDCDARTSYDNPTPTDSLTMMTCLHWAASTRLAEYELDRLKNHLKKNNLYIIRPTENYVSHALDIDNDKLQKYFDHGVEMAKHFIKKIFY